MSVRAMKAGAVDFLIKPFHDQDLLDAIHAAIAHDRKRRRQAVDALFAWPGSRKQVTHPRSHAGPRLAYSLRTQSRLPRR